MWAAAPFSSLVVTQSPILRDMNPRRSWINHIQKGCGNDIIKRSPLAGTLVGVGALAYFCYRLELSPCHLSPRLQLHPHEVPELYPSKFLSCASTDGPWRRRIGPCCTCQTDGLSAGYLGVSVTCCSHLVESLPEPILQLPPPSPHDCLGCLAGFVLPRCGPHARCSLCCSHAVHWCEVGVRLRGDGG